MIVSSSSFKHQRGLKSAIFRHWLGSVFVFPLLFRSPHNFSIQMQMSLSHTVSEHSAFLSSLIFSPQNCVCWFHFSGTWTNQDNFHFSAYTGSWDSITSASSSLVALLVLSIGFSFVFGICVVLQRHRISETWIPYSAAVMSTEDYWENNHPQKSCLDVLRCSHSSRIWETVRFIIMDVIPVFYFYFQIINPESPYKSCFSPLIQVSGLIPQWPQPLQ